ncbi:MAG TPA: hypothetical protein VGA36_09825 [Nitriliruptorales bacterium]
MRLSRGAVFALIVACLLVGGAASVSAQEPVGYSVITVRDHLHEDHPLAVARSAAELARLWEPYDFFQRRVGGPPPDPEYVEPTRQPPPVDFSRAIVAVFVTNGTPRPELLGVDREEAAVSLQLSTPEPGVSGWAFASVWAVALDRHGLPDGPMDLRLVLDGEVVDAATAELAQPPSWRPSGRSVAFEVAVREVLGASTGLDLGAHNRAPLHPVLVTSDGDLVSLWHRYDPSHHPSGEGVEHHWGPLPDLDFGEQVAVVFTTTSGRHAVWDVTGVRAGDFRLAVQLGLEPGPGRDLEVVDLWVLTVDRSALAIGPLEVAVEGPDGHVWSQVRARVTAPPAALPWQPWWLGGVVLAGIVLAVVARPVVRRRESGHR